MNKLSSGRRCGFDPQENPIAEINIRCSTMGDLIPETHCRCACGGKKVAIGIGGSLTPYETASPQLLKYIC